MTRCEEEKKTHTISHTLKCVLHFLFDPFHFVIWMWKKEIKMKRQIQRNKININFELLKTSKFDYHLYMTYFCVFPFHFFFPLTDNFPNSFHCIFSSCSFWWISRYETYSRNMCQPFLILIWIFSPFFFLERC